MFSLDFNWEEMVINSKISKKSVKRCKSKSKVFNLLAESSMWKSSKQCAFTWVYMIIHDEELVIDKCFELFLFYRKLGILKILWKSNKIPNTITRFFFAEKHIKSR